MTPTTSMPTRTYSTSLRTPPASSLRPPSRSPTLAIDYGRRSAVTADHRGLKTPSASAHQRRLWPLSGTCRHEHHWHDCRGHVLLRRHSPELPSPPPSTFPRRPASLCRSRRREPFHHIHGELLSVLRYVPSSTVPCGSKSCLRRPTLAVMSMALQPAPGPKPAARHARTHACKRATPASK